MSFKFALQKILEVKETDKLKAEKEFALATKQFEEVARKLYELLKKKETYEKEYYTKIEVGIHVHEIQQLQTIQTKLQQQIDQLQFLTHKARENMNRKEETLVEMSIEVKKYEKMKELKYQNYITEQKRQETILMDEISVLQFMNR